jgi:hypothetical protein
MKTEKIFNIATGIIYTEYFLVLFYLIFYFPENLLPIKLSTSASNKKKAYDFISQIFSERITFDCTHFYKFLMLSLFHYSFLGVAQFVVPVLYGFGIRGFDAVLIRSSV